MPLRIRLVAAGALVFVAGTVVLFPARVAYEWFAPESVRLSGISGTVWSGSAAEGSFDGFYAGNLGWRFRPAALLTAKLGYAVAADPSGGLLEGNVAISPGGAVHLGKLRAGLPLAALGDAAAAAGAEGVLDLAFDSLVLHDGWPVRAAGTAEVRGLVIPVLSSAPLGDYHAAFETVDGIVTGRFEDVSGVLDLDGTLELQADRSYVLSGRVRASNAAPTGLVQQLRFLGSPDEEGMRTFRFEGQL